VCENRLSIFPNLVVIISQAVSFRRPFELIISLADDIFPGEFADCSITSNVSTLLVLRPEQERHLVEDF